jgi:hypothetical protein
MNRLRFPSPLRGGVRGGGRFRYKRVERVDNTFHHTVDICGDVHIAESKYRKSLAFEIALTAQVARNLGIRRMCRAINFYNQSMGQAGKIYNEMIDWHLSAKLLSRDLQVPQPMPESTLGGGSISPQLAGAPVDQLKFNPD